MKNPWEKKKKKRGAKPKKRKNEKKQGGRTAIRGKREQIKYPFEGRATRSSHDVGHNSTMGH